MQYTDFQKQSVGCALKVLVNSLKIFFDIRFINLHGVLLAPSPPP